MLFRRVAPLLATVVISAHAQGLGARAEPKEYSARAATGAYTIAAEFKGHSIPTLDGTFTSEDYVAVEVAVFGPADAKLKLASTDFSMRINGKKTPSPADQYTLVFKSLKDPEWQPPEGTEKKSKGGFGGGGGGANDPPPVPPKMLLPLRRAMEQKVIRASLPEGERPLPQAGLIYFSHRGKAENIHSLELIYEGPAGKVAFELQPYQ